MWNESYESLSSDKSQTAQGSEAISRVPGGAGTCHALDRDPAHFANRRINENDDELNLLEKNVQLIGG